MILPILRDATAAEHAAIEAVVGLMDPHVTRAVYRDYLARVLGYYEPLEARLADVLAGHPYADEYAQRRKLGRLERDLVQLGETDATLAALPRCSPADLPAIATTAQAFGCLYVLEGSTLGGQFITRHLHATLHLDPAVSCTFLGSYGPDTGRMWRAFGTTITAQADAMSEVDRVALVDAARETFVTLRRWLATDETRA